MIVLLFRIRKAPGSALDPETTCGFPLSLHLNTATVPQTSQRVIHRYVTYDIENDVQQTIQGSLTEITYCQATGMTMRG